MRNDAGDGCNFAGGVVKVGNGETATKAWDAFWKVLSLLVIPWASFVSWGLWQVTSDAKAAEQSRVEHSRRLELLEAQMQPVNRFYRWDGDALDVRIIELESLHPRRRLIDQ